MAMFAVYTEHMSVFVQDHNPVPTGASCFSGTLLEKKFIVM